MPLLPVIFTLCALRFTLPTNFGANAPPTCQFHALRFQLTTLNGTWDKGHGTKRQRLANGEQKTLKPSTRNAFLRFTHYASRSTLNSQRATRNQFRG
jgi:hypothetical protein